MCMNKNAELLPYYERAKELLNYDPKTGLFTWKQTRTFTAIKGSVAGSKDKCGYLRVCITLNRIEKTLKLHRLAYLIIHGEMPNIVDHINLIKDDNRAENLRTCNAYQNQMNKAKLSSNKTGYKGVVYVESRGKYRAKIGYKGKNLHLGHFDCPKKAHEAYVKKSKELAGEFHHD